MKNFSFDKTSSIYSRPGVNNSLIHIACVVLLILIIYGNTINAPFQWDESTHIVGNAIVKDLSYFLQLSKAKGIDQYDFVSRRYIAFLTFAFNYRIHGLSVPGYHIVNIAIHISNAILVYLLVLLTFRTPYLRNVNLDSHSLIAFFSAAIFAVHPLQTEAVTYIMQRFASLAAFFYLLSLVTYIKFRLETKRNAVRWTLCAITLFSAVLAMKTKENAFTLPFIIVLYEFCFFDNARCSTRFFYLIPVLLTLCIIPLALTGTHDLDPRAYGDRIFSRWDYFFTQFRVIVTYVRLFFFPVKQNFAYDYPVYRSFFEMPVLLSFIFLLSIFVTGIYLLWRSGSRIWLSDRLSALYRLIGFGIIWFFITLSVESSIIPLWMLINEYRMYLPSVGLIITVVTGAFLLKEKVKVKPVFILSAFVLVITVLSVATLLRNELWSDNISIWEDTVGKSPCSAIAHYSLGIVYKDRDMLQKAIEQYLIAIKLKPDYAQAHNNLGVVYASLYMPEEAMEQYQLAINLKPDYAFAHNNLGIVYVSLNKPDKAIEQYLTAIRLNPDYDDAHCNLGYAYYKMGQRGNAYRELHEALRINPNNHEAQQLIGSLCCSSFQE